LNKTITTLRLTHNNIPDEGIAALADSLRTRQHKTVTEIDVSGNRIQGKGAKAFADLLGMRACTLKSVSASTEKASNIIQNPYSLSSHAAPYFVQGHVWHNSSPLPLGSQLLGMPTRNAHVLCSVHALMLN